MVMNAVMMEMMTLAITIMGAMMNRVMKKRTIKWMHMTMFRSMKMRMIVRNTMSNSIIIDEKDNT